MNARLRVRVGRRSQFADGFPTLPAALAGLGARASIPNLMWAPLLRTVSDPGPRQPDSEAGAPASHHHGDGGAPLALRWGGGGRGVASQFIAPGHPARIDPQPEWGLVWSIVLCEAGGHS